MDILDWISIAIALIAVGFSGVIFVRDNHRYRIPLQLRIPYYLVVWNEGNRSLILFRLIFVNPSLSGRTVVKILIKPPTGITETEAEWEYDAENMTVTVSIPNSDQTMTFPIDEMLQEVLDIPPHQSRSKWIGYYFDFENLQQENEQVGNPPKENMSHVEILFVAHDVNDKPAVAPIALISTLTELMIEGAHSANNIVYRSYKWHPA